MLAFSRLSSLSAAASLIALTLTFSEAGQAKDTSGEGVLYSRMGYWTTDRIDDRCSLVSAPNAGPFRVLIEQHGASPQTFRLVFEGDVSNDFQTTDSMRVVIDDVRIPARWEPDRNSVLVDDFTEDMVSAFRRGRVLQLLLQERVFARTYLGAPSAAYAAFRLCARPVRAGPSKPDNVPPAPPSPPPTSVYHKPAQASLAPPPPPLHGRPPIPINPAQWIRTADFKSGLGDGNVSFHLLVNANGRVSNCRVSETTGTAELGARTCQLLTRRARFKPALDQENNKTSGLYSNTVRWRDVSPQHGQAPNDSPTDGN